MIVLWYFSSVTKPIYSYDARDGKFNAGKIWYDTQKVGERASFSPKTNPPKLVLNPVEGSDQGLYTCRVDYRVSPPTKTILNLTVVIPPGAPTVLWRGEGVIGTVGPIRENERIELVCRSIGGRPTPSITWWNDRTRVNHVNFHTTSDPVTGNYMVESTLSIFGSREHQGAPLTCQVNTPSDAHIINSPRLHSKTVSVTLNITLPPVEVRILGSSSLATTSGSQISLVCRAFGSHPATQLMWLKDDQDLRSFATQMIEDGGNVTTSVLKMNVSRKDDGATLTCKAVNPAISEHSLADTTNLIVSYSPIVTLSLGRALDASSIKEGDDVYFECNIKSNPPYHRIEWFHNGSPLSHNVSAGIRMSSESLVLPGLQRRHSGSYKCFAVNTQGSDTSNAVRLTVRHAPVCAGPEVERTQGAVRGATTKVKCQVEAEPSRPLSWEWMKMRVDGTEEDVSPDLVQSNGLSSSIQVTPLRQDDYGRLLCRATNSVGRQEVACIVSLMPAGPPEMPINCSAIPTDQETEEGHLAEDSSIVVRCLEGFDGGLKQYFLLEAWQDGQLFANMTSDLPEWVLSDVRMGVGVTLNIAAHNARGHSDAYALEVQTSNNAPQRAAPADYQGFVALAPLLGAAVGAVGVILLLLIVGVVIVKRAPQRPIKSESDLQRTSTIPEGFDPDVVQSIQRQPPSLDVLPCLQDQECGQTGGASVCSDPDAGATSLSKNYTNGSTTSQENNQYQQLNYTSLPRSQNSYERNGKRGPQQGLSPGNDSGLSESESDSEIKELVSKGQSTKLVKQEDVAQTYVHPTGDGIHPQLSTVTDHLTEPSTSSGDSGIQSSSSTKPFSLFSASEDKARSAMLKEFRPPTATASSSGKHIFSSQSPPVEQRLSPATTGDLRRGMPISYSSTPSPLASSSHILYSKDDLASVAGLQPNMQRGEINHSYLSHTPFSSGNDVAMDDHKYLEYGRPATILEGDHEEVVLLRRQNAPYANGHKRRNSALGFATDKIYDFSPTRYSSSSDLHSIGGGFHTPGLPDSRVCSSRDRSDILLTDHHQGKSKIRQADVLPSPSLSSPSNKDTKITMKDTGDRSYKFPFNFNFSERESSV